MSAEVLARLNALTLRALAANGQEFRPALPPEQEFSARFFGDGLRSRVPHLPDPTIAVTYEDDMVLVPLSILEPWLHSDQAPANIGMGVVGPDRDLPAGADAGLRFSFSEGAKVEIESGRTVRSFFRILGWRLKRLFF